MKKLVSTLKALHLRQVVTIFLVGVLVLVSTACSRTDTIADRMPGKGPNTPGQSQPYKGGMNNFNDDASNRLNTEAAAKAKALRDKVQSRVNTKGINNPDDLADNVRSADPGKQAKRFGADLRQKTEDVKDNLQNAGDRGVKNVKRNADNALDDATNASNKISRDVNAQQGAS